MKQKKFQHPKRTSFHFRALVRIHSSRLISPWATSWFCHYNLIHSQNCAGSISSIFESKKLAHSTTNKSQLFPTQNSLNACPVFSSEILNEGIARRAATSTSSLIERKIFHMKKFNPSEGDQ